MTQTGTLQKYELVVIVDAKLTGEQKDSIIKEVTAAISKAGGKVINSQIWFEKQRFTFQIRKAAEGTYYLINFEADGTVNAKVNTDLRLNERILRYILVAAENN